MKTNANCVAQTIASYIGGSHLYNLATEESDLDYRHITKRTDLPYVMGFLKTEAKQKTSETEDSVTYEVKHFLNLLQKTNTQVLESLFIPREGFLIYTEDFQLIQENKHRLICPYKLVKSTAGYVHNEIRLALGERTGLLGSKRKEALDKYGFSPKNVCQLIRLVAATEHFIETGDYLLDLSSCSKWKAIHDAAFAIKTQPEIFSISDIKRITKLCNERAKDLLDKTIKIDYCFDVETAARILKQITIDEK